MIIFSSSDESRGRVRLRAVQPSMTMEQADLLEAWLLNQPGVEQATVHERICGVIIVFRGVRAELYDALAAFSYEKAAQQTRVLSRNSRAINREYKQKLVMKVVRRYLKKLFLPLVFRRAINACLAAPRIWRALRVLRRGRLTVDVLDGVAIGVSLLTGDFSTAGSVRFLLGVGETLDEWTHKKSVDDLAKSMSLQVDQVWLQRGDGEQTLVPLDSVQPGDRIVIHTGHVLPMDGILEQGDVMLNRKYQKKDAQNAANAAKYPGSFETKTMLPPEAGYDFSYHNLVCPLSNFARAHGYEEYMPYLCNLDYVMFGAFGVPLFREHTCFADGDYCDFKLKIDAEPLAWWPPVFQQENSFQ